MICPNLNDPVVKSKFDQLLAVVPEYAYYLWNKYEGEVPAKYYNLGISYTSSDVMYSKATMEDIKNHYLRLEINLDLLNGLLNSEEYNNLDNLDNKVNYISTKIWDIETGKIKHRKSIRLQGNRIYHQTSEKVKAHQVLKYAESTANSINQTYVITGGKKIAWARFDETGVYVEFDPRSNFALPITQMIESIEEEEVRAEAELIALHQTLEEERAVVLEKLIQANEMIIDGEVLPLNNIMFQKHMGLMAALKNPNTEKFGQIFDKLVAKFPGVTWAWDTTVKGAAVVDFNSGQILVNPYLVKADTAWHEFSHFIIRGLKQSNPEAFKNIIAELERLHEESPTTSSKSYVEANYPELIGTPEFWEEVIATEVGAQASEYNPKTGIYETVLNFFKSILSDLGLYNPKFETLNDLVEGLHNPGLNFKVYPTNKAVSDYMWSRVTPSQLEEFTKHLRTDPDDPNNYSPAINQIQLISDAITDQEFARMMDTNKYFLSEDIRNSTSLRQAGAIFSTSKARMKTMLTKEDVAESVLDLSNYMQYMSIYFQSLISHLQTLTNDPKIPPGKKLGDIHRAYKQALVVKRHLEEIVGTDIELKAELQRGVFKPNTISDIAALAQTGGKEEIQKNPFIKNYFWLSNSIRSILNKHEQYIQSPILDELEEYYAESTKSLAETLAQDITQLVSQLGKKSFDVVGQTNKNEYDKVYKGKEVKSVTKLGTGVDTKFSVVYTDGAKQDFTNFRSFRQSFDFPISVINLLNRLQDSKDDYETSLPTRANLKSLLMDTKSELYAAIDTATNTKNPGIQLVASYLKGMEMSYRASLPQLRATAQTLMEDLIREEGGQFLGSIVDVKEFYKPYYKETVLFEVVDGVLKKDKRVVVLNTATDTVAMRNFITEQSYIIQHGMDAVADLSPTDMSPEAIQRRQEAELKVKQAEQALEDFKERYTERPFTDEYYEIQNRLPLEIRNKRNNLFREMSAIRESFLGGEISTDAFELLREAQSELDEMESLYDSYGNIKTGDAFDTAKAIMDWKSAKRNNEIQKKDSDGKPMFDSQGNPIMESAPIMVYPPLSEETQNLFERTLNTRKERLNNVLNNPNSTDKQKQEANDEYNRWASLYTRTTYKQAFYDERNFITSEIQELLGSNGEIDDLYNNLFNLLRGKKDRNGEYMPNEISQGQRATAKQIEEKIESIKGLARGNSLDKDTKERLSILLQQLQFLQSSINSKAYNDTVEKLKAELRSDIATKNPDLDNRSIDKLVDQRFKDTQWFKDNHIVKNRYDEDREEVIAVYEPLFMWRVTRPNNPDYIETEAPSYLWYTPKINPAYQNSKFVPGDTTFKEPQKGDIYYNNNYDNLRDSQKALLERMRALSHEAQEGLYKRDKLGDIIPSVYKTKGQMFIDLITGRNNPFIAWWHQTKEFFLGSTRQALGDTDETFGIADQVDAFGEPITRESRRLFVRYSRALDAQDQSYDLMAAISQYAESAIRFKTIRKYQSTILAMEELLSKRTAKSKINGKVSSTAASVVGDLIDRELYGKGINNPKTIAGKIANGALHVAGRFAGAKSLAFNVVSLAPNWFNGYKNNYADRRFYNLTYKNYLSAARETLGLAYDFYTSNAQAGNKPLRMQIVDFFGGTQSKYAHEFADVSNTGLLKYSKIYNFVNVMRDYTEYDIAAQTVFAMLDKYRVPLVNGTGSIKLKDAFHLVNGAIQVRQDVDVNPTLLRKIRHEISTANYRAQGVYDTIGQPTVAKYAIVRQLLFLKKWVPMHAKTEWGSSTLHYGAGVKTVGANLAMMRYLQQTFFEYGRFWEASKNLSHAERAALAKFRFNFFTYLALGNIITQMALSLNCEDDGDADWKDYTCFFAKKIANEAEGIFTMWGMNEMLFTYVQETANGVSLFEKLGWTIFGPFSVFRKFVDWDSGLYSTDPYYKYKPNSDKIDWDKTHPVQAGKPGLGVLGMEILGAKGIYLGLDPKSIEFQNRAFNDYMPKTYTKELRTRYQENHQGLEEMKTRTEEAQAKKQYKKQLKGLQKQARAYEQVGEDVPEEIYRNMEHLETNYAKRLEEISTGRKPSPIFTGVKPFFMSRPGLDMNESEIEEDDFED